MNRQPSTLKIIIIDYPAFVAAIFPPIAWGFYLFLPIIGGITLKDLLLPIIFGILTIISLAVITWRIQMFKTIFSDGIEAQGVIGSVFFFRDRGRVDYIYSYQNQKYTSSHPIHKVKQTRELYPGQPVTLMVDRNNPKRAYIRDLFI